MGACLCNQGKGTVEERNIDDQINKHMKTEDKLKNTTHRILLLGPGDAGKTTILKQMRKIYLGHIPDDIIDSYKTYIRHKLIHYMKILCEQAHKLNIPINVSSEVSRKYILDLQTPCDLNKDISSHLKLLWNDNSIQNTLKQREKFQIADNVNYFFDQRFDDIISNKYKPTFSDYLRIRMRTTGFCEETFTTSFHKNKLISNKSNIITPNTPNTPSNNHRNSKKYKDLELELKKADDLEQEKQMKYSRNSNNKNGSQHSFIFTDVGGQRSERKKWLHMMNDDINAVVYIVAISEYDLKCFEDLHTRRLKEALDLFQKVIRKGFLTNKTVTIFFNKYDLLLEKLRDPSKSTIKDHFPEFPDNRDPRNPDHVCEFVYSKFLDIFRTEMPRNNTTPKPHYHRTSALDTNQIDNLMGDIQSDLIRNQLKMAGF